ncbi:erythroid differentiation-related factor 1-like [Centruroides sculpturatus]|uniref:erythroid differentiation-related factor 1-like n=1 Tax=Centruroides sculpturatus TaxID=218467 RepID=UPI000C6EEB8A|nr:erythroid differentiation-related factor 1-like [Centruroides sculpturatus]
MELSSNTDLNQPPSNWLRSQAKWKGRWGRWAYPRSHSTTFSSFHLAHNFPDCVGEVDVISDSENIKKLLKIPYSKSHISMMVHCIGKTLLLDEFDVHSHLLRAQKQWEWLKKFFKEHILQTLEEEEKCMLRKNKSRDYLQNKNMFSKFLYYSIAEGSSEEESESTKPEKSSEDTAKPSNLKSSRETTSPIAPFTDYTVNIPDPIKEVEDEVQDSGQEFLRNVLWTFEDIRMLIGSDMPIFGGGTHPAVSLKLRDMKKPINVLTGLDYWLDNLMCNVPEVVMCYHLNGIVQKYEFIKTRDIPYIKNSQFSPNVVKDIAQNILSFLKSNATKSGHTYWLFKGKNDDVVKLYDLTTLCSEVIDDKEQNPFTLPVAMLLYKVARNMMKSVDAFQNQKTIYKLLKNCLVLLDEKKHPKVVTSIHYLLSDIYVPSNIDLATIHNFAFEESESSDDISDGSMEDEDDLESDSNDNIMSVDVQALCVPHMLKREEYKKNEKSSFRISKNWNDRCRDALSHVLKALQCLLEYDEEKENEDENIKKQNSSQEQKEGEVKIANPYQSIPLNYSPLHTFETNSAGDDKSLNEDFHTECFESDNNKASQTSPANKNITSVPINSDSWTNGCQVLLLRKAVEIYCSMVEISNKVKKYGETLKNIKMGLICYECTQFIVINQNASWSTEPLAYLLELAGDIHFMMVHNEQYIDQQLQKEEFYNLSSQDNDILEMLEHICKKKISYVYSWAYSWPVDLESSLNLSCRCYETAQNVLCDKSKKDFERLVKRQGNICNELGVFYMNQGTRLWNETGKLMDKISELWKKSHSFLERGIKAFQDVNDIANIALLYSNTGRLMRLWAHAQVPTNNDGTRKEFSSQERKYYNKAISYYNAASQVLDNHSKFPEIWDTVNWELSTTLFTMASLLQDYAPHSAFGQEEIEKEVNELMLKALKLCEYKDVVGPKQAIYQYRTATIHHRLGSLYHNSYRNQMYNDSRCKQMRTLADSHYVKACTIFGTLDHCNEFLRAAMERIGLWEHHLNALTGFGSKVKTLQIILECMVSARPVLKLIIKRSETDVAKVNSQSPSDESEEEKNEQDRLLSLFEQRLQFVLKTLVKCYSNKPSKFKDTLKIWNEIYSACVQSFNDIPHQSHLYDMLEKIEHHLQNN